ncbi:hypothetical protein J2T12_004691 [Paenibacillus anaericanus]|nr:hypothetical protein [Paenibacillus anaericanus]
MNNKGVGAFITINGWAIGRSQMALDVLNSALYSY